MRRDVIGQKRIAEFIEDDFISAVQIFICNCTFPRHPVEICRVSNDDERELGYDGIVTSLVPFYVQFKRSTFHTPQFNGKTATDRNALGLACRSGFFSFSLHKHAYTRSFEQHNALYKLSQHAKAAYVAPMFYKKAHLSDFKFHSTNWPWQYKTVVVSERYGSNALEVVAPSVRMIHECMTIPPHREITDRLQSHHYSFTREGQVCFHSEPEAPDFPAVTLSQFISEIIEYGFSQTSDHQFESAQIMKLLPGLLGSNWDARSFRSMIRGYLIELDLLHDSSQSNIFDNVFQKLSDTDRWLLAEYVLKDVFNIVQFLVKRRKI